MTRCTSKHMINSEGCLREVSTLGTWDTIVQTLSEALDALHKGFDGSMRMRTQQRKIELAHLHLINALKQAGN